MPTFEYRSVIPAPAQAVWDWHMRPGAFARLNPPWQPVELVQAEPVREGSRTTLRMRLGGRQVTWIAQHQDVQPPSQFTDVQVTGPFAQWIHTHRMEPAGPDRCTLIDQVTYRLPAAWLSQPLAGRHMRRQLQRLFAYRHRVTARDLAVGHPFAGGSAMKVLITGASGLVGQSLTAMLTTAGHQVQALRRGEAGDSPTWDPDAGRIDAEKLEGCDAVVHLAGENISAGRWTDKQKQRIRDSRVQGTSLLARTLAGLTHKPRVLVCASAIGYYGHRGDQVLTEDSPKGDSFLAEVCQAWEQAADPAREAGIRVAHLRFGMILSAQGGALARMLLPFKLGLGGPVGSGRQWWSWIALDDAMAVIHHSLINELVEGPVNSVSPRPVTSREFARVLGRVLGRPAFMPMPGFAARLALGQMADELLLASARVEPTRLTQTGFHFGYEELEAALRHLLGR